MRKREVYWISKNRKKERTDPRLWLERANNLLLDFVYLWVEDEGDLVGAAQMARFLSWFYGVRVTMEDVLDVWRLIRDGKVRATDISLGFLLRRPSFRVALGGQGSTRRRRRKGTPK